MNPTDIFMIALLVAVIGGAVYAIYRSRKRGKKCIGCPHSASCPGNCK